MRHHTSLNLKGDEAHRLAKELSERTGKSMTAAVIEALREQPARVEKESEAEFVERIMAITKGTRQERHEPYRRLDDVIRRMGIVTEPVTEQQAGIARRADRDDGKGSGHPAGPDFGDCFACALARAAGEPLLFKGDDFIQTDVTPPVKEPS